MQQCDTSRIKSILTICASFYLSFLSLSSSFLCWPCVYYHLSGMTKNLPANVSHSVCHSWNDPRLLSELGHRPCVSPLFCYCFHVFHTYQESSPAIGNNIWSEGNVGCNCKKWLNVLEIIILLERAELMESASLCIWDGVKISVCVKA